MSREQDAVDDDQPEIYHVPGAWNHYKYNDDVVVLDANLEEYPKAREAIKEHEIRHREARSTLDLLRHEFYSDVELYFSTDETAEEIREYYKTEHSGNEDGLLRRIGHGVVDYFRSIWCGVMSLLGPVYRRWLS